ncbi:MAG: FumA C-terminus/TtdB family hydratase beta subunit [Candidatus Hadarchaeales archaeon]
MKIVELRPPFAAGELKRFHAGDLVTISGVVATARDKAYQRVVSEEKFPVDVKGGVVYHCGPLAVRRGERWEILSAGPTTSARLDSMEGEFIKKTGVRAIVGKGGVGEEVAKKMKELGCIYLAFPGGAGVLAAEKIEGVEKVLWEELGAAEAVWVLKVKDFGPLVVAVDLHGGNIYSRRNF